jgi:hypothetical protein
MAPSNARSGCRTASTPIKSRQISRTVYSRSRCRKRRKGKGAKRRSRSKRLEFGGTTQSLQSRVSSRLCKRLGRRQLGGGHLFTSGSTIRCQSRCVAMPYRSNSDLPAAVRSHLPPHGPGHLPRGLQSCLCRPCRGSGAGGTCAPNCLVGGQAVLREGWRQLDRPYRRELTYLKHLYVVGRKIHDISRTGMHAKCS